MGTTLGCYSEMCFATLISTGIIEGVDMCNGCLLSQEHAFGFDAEHVCSTSAMKCSLALLLHGLLIRVLCEVNEPASQLQELEVSGSMRSILRQKFIDMVLDAKEGRGRKFYYQLVNGSWRTGFEVEVLPESGERVGGYLRNLVTRSEVLVYKPMARSSMMNNLAFMNLVKDSWSRVRIVNGDKAFGYCARSWVKGNHREQRKCNRDVIVEVLVHASYEKMALAEYLNTHRISIRNGTVCHFIDLMVYREDNNEPIFFNFVDFLIRRYEAVE